MDAVAGALHRLGDHDAVVAHHAVFVGQGTVGHAAVLDEAVHVDAEQRQAEHAGFVDVVLGRGAKVGRTPWVEVRVAGGGAVGNAEDRSFRCFRQRVVELETAAPGAQVQRHHVLGVGQSNLEVVGHVQREVGRGQHVLIAALGRCRAHVLRFVAVGTRIAAEVLGHIKVGVDQAHADVAAEWHVPHRAGEITLKIARQLLQAHGPGGARLGDLHGVRIERLPEGDGVDHRIGIDRPEVDARAEQVVVLLEVARQRCGRVGHRYRRQRARAEVALVIAGRARATVQHHVGADVTHQASAGIARADTCVHRRLQCPAFVVGAADAVAHAKLQLEAVLEVVLAVKAQGVERHLPVVIARRFQGLHGPVGRVGKVGGQR